MGKQGVGYVEAQLQPGLAPPGELAVARETAVPKYLGEIFNLTAGNGRHIEWDANHPAGAARARRGSWPPPFSSAAGSLSGRLIVSAESCVRSRAAVELRIFIWLIASRRSGRGLRCCCAAQVSTA